jgi:hypothetical protein
MSFSSAAICPDSAKLKVWLHDADHLYMFSAPLKMNRINNSLIITVADLYKKNIIIDSGMLRKCVYIYV